MYTYYLLIFLILYLIIIFSIFKKDIFNPSFILVSVFIIAIIDGILNHDIWNFSLHKNTFMVVLSGLGAFIIVSYIVHLFYNQIRYRKSKKNINSNPKYNKEIIIQKEYYIIFFVIEIIVYLLVLLQVIKIGKSLGGGSDIFSCINAYMMAEKFSTKNVSFPFILSQIYSVVKASAYIWGYVLVNNYFGKKQINKLALTNFLISLLGGFITGSRGASFRLFLSVLAIIFLFCKVKLGKRTIKFKYIIYIFIIIFTLFFSFTKITTFLGRGEINSTFAYISVYLGAPMKNLDSFLQEIHEKPEIFGYNTFAYLTPEIAEKIGNEELVYLIDLPKRKSIYGYPLGNVYTTFYSYIYDFGYIGLLVCTMIMAIVIQILYERSLSVIRSGKLGKINFSVLFYSYFFYSIALSFFSNKFYESFTLSNLKMFLIWYLLKIVFERIRFKKSI